MARYKQQQASHSFAKNAQANISRSTFDRSHTLKTTFNADKLVPIFVDEVLPADTHKLRANLFGRLATPINPLMDNLYLDTFYFFVPMRLVWENTEKFFGQQDNPNDSIDYLIPTYRNGPSTGQEMGLTDYFGVPVVEGVEINVLPLRAYWLIYNEWFRDQNLQESHEVIKVDGSGVTTGSWNTLATRGKRHDYFTSCLPWAQKGDPAFVPLGDEAPIRLNAETGEEIVTEGKLDVPYNWNSNNQYVQMGIPRPAEQPNLYADLTLATGASINDWRKAFQIQKFLERDARSGTRYTEKILAHFGVSSPDARLQRPEYLGGSSQPINVHPVPQTSSSDSATPQGNLGAFGTVSENQSGFTKSFTEHGYIIGLANVRADLTYQQGLDKLWSREIQYDFFFPAFAHLGEQAVKNKEIFAAGTPNDDGTFGYQERYAEYRYKRSQVTGLFRSDATASLDAWHLAQDFANCPTLGDTFIKSNTPMDRVLAVPSEPDIILDCFFNYKSTRPMPTYGTPGFIDHF